MSFSPTKTTFFSQNSNNIWKVLKYFSSGLGEKSPFAKFALQSPFWRSVPTYNITPNIDLHTYILSTCQYLVQPRWSLMCRAKNYGALLYVFLYCFSNTYIELPTQIYCLAVYMNFFFSRFLLADSNSFAQQYLHTEWFCNPMSLFAKNLQFSVNVCRWLITAVLYCNAPGCYVCQPKIQLIFIISRTKCLKPFKGIVSRDE